MKEKRIIDAMGQIDEKYVEEASAVTKKKKSSVIKWVSLAASVALLVAIAVPVINNQKNNIELSDGSSGVKVKYTDNVRNIAISNSLADLTEEELFSEFNTSIFRGKVTDIKNVVIDYNGSKNYNAVATVKADKIYRGDLKENDSVTILLPCPVDGSVMVEDTETVTQMKVGTVGIFMATKYDESSVRSENGATLQLSDIAGYGLPDGVRYLFLETENGIAFDRTSYETISNAKTLSEVEAYIEKMIKG